MTHSIWIGYDRRPAEMQCYFVAKSSIRRRLNQPLPIHPLKLAALREEGFYTREHEHRDGKLWDVISDAPMSTEFAISRFLVPKLAYTQWALFVDADVMARTCLTKLFQQADPAKACMVVKHAYTPSNMFKMDGQAQTFYERKNWSSVVLWNCEHPGTKHLTMDLVNSARGLWLHQFSWLDDSDIGALDPAWNHLVGEHAPDPYAKLVHFTNGSPNMPGHEHCEFAGEWWSELEHWV
jgi:hypothetical protein